jgi:hypothetical protein
MSAIVPRYVTDGEPFTPPCRVSPVVSRSVTSPNVALNVISTGFSPDSSSEIEI